MPLLGTLFCLTLFLVLLSNVTSLWGVGGNKYLVDSTSSMVWKIKLSSGVTIVGLLWPYKLFHGVVTNTGKSIVWAVFVLNLSFLMAHWPYQYHRQGKHRSIYLLCSPFYRRQDKHKTFTFSAHPSMSLARHGVTIFWCTVSVVAVWVASVCVCVCVCVCKLMKCTNE